MAESLRSKRTAANHEQAARVRAQTADTVSVEGRGVGGVGWGWVGWGGVGWGGGLASASLRTEHRPYASWDTVAGDHRS